MRRCGKRLADREISNGPSYEGNLSTAYLSLPAEHYFFASLSNPANHINPHVVPDLYQPVLVSAGNGVLLLRGFERIDTANGPCAVVQEWRCEVVVR